MDKTKPVVYVVDDEDQIRHSLSVLLGTLGLQVQAYGDAEEFLNHYKPDQPGCLILDVRMPGMSGIELQWRLNSAEISVPVIIITGHGDVPMAVEAIKMGAVDFIEKPFREQALLESVQKGIKLDAEKRQQQTAQNKFKEVLTKLTPREQEIARELALGKINKVIAYELGISQKTVDFHRGNIMKKLKIDSVVELVRIIQELKIDLETTKPDF
ncbi:MAG: response regulator transcription factor [Planctomycetota bacterium]|jgi:FixJ family two-component response regulator